MSEYGGYSDLTFLNSQIKNLLLQSGYSDLLCF